MGLLIASLILFIGIHFVPAMEGVRSGLVQRFGDNGYKGLFSVLSTLTLVFLVWAYATSPFVAVWSPPVWTRHLALLLMLPAMIMLMSAFFPGRIKTALKHPMLVAIKTWALAHLLANGDLASMFLFGTFLAYAVIDRIMQKGKGERAPATAAPGKYNDAIVVVAGFAIYLAVAFYLHELVIGVPVIA